MGPPPLSAKLKRLDTLVGDPQDPKDTRAAARILRKYANSFPKLEAQLELYTFEEFKSLLKALRADYKSLSIALKARTADKVGEFVKTDSNTAGLQLRELKPLAQVGIKARVDTIEQIKRLDLNRDELKRKGLEKETTIIQYIIDRRQSRVLRD
jgi:hypothetical protein